ncbi:MAG: pyrroline-5-carboxylate reductase [Chlamydiae bacterium]|nr:pyrroline-5-carboxylate reductase [Chlamydiota bacterium]MBI3266124.1 pyrroline-5-carboxylate reductase [Chlamydiota bacterium]
MSVLENKKLLLIGAGNMAEALIQGVQASREMLPENIGITEIRQERRDFIQKKFGVRVFEKNRDGVRLSDIILFAVKPQNVNEVLDEIKGEDLSSKTLITIAAGIPIKRFEEKLGKGVRVIRVMPNMPALVGKGISGVSRGTFAGSEDEKIALQMMGSVGETVPLPENLLDAVTAVSGSGPAYFFYLMEAMVEAGVRLGLTPEVSRKLVEATAMGASFLVKETQESPESLRKKVTSPGGTTEAALKIFQESSVREAIIRGIERAQKRSEELRG